MKKILEALSIYSILKRISELLDNDELACSMGKVAKDYVTSNLTMPAIAERYSKLFDPILET